MECRSSRGSCCADWVASPKASSGISKGKYASALIRVAYKTHGFRFRSQSTFPHFVHVANDCFSCMIASITIDFLRKIPFRICKRSDCGTPFAADRRGKQYCSQYCAHLVSLRKARKELKKRAVNEARLSAEYVTTPG